MKIDKICPNCGGILKKKLSFNKKGKFPYIKQKRETLYCEDKKCGYSCIIPTEREQMIQDGLLDN